MIELTFEEFLLWMVGAPMVLMGIYSLLVGANRRARNKKAKDSVIVCRVCGHLYQDCSKDKSPICPACNRGNDRGRSRRLG